MPLSLPPATEMLATIRDYLETAILPELAGERWFNLKVACNMLAMVERELALGADASEAERERLVHLLGESGMLEEMNARLGRAIREGALALDDTRLLAHLRRTTADALAINNPRWLSPQKGS
jgi:Domain of unknown function (DUF6285)